jgi:hypothetical protein
MEPDTTGKQVPVPYSYSVRAKQRLLKALRAGLTQTQTCKAAGIGRSTLLNR